jgi:hypothetical protein
MDFAIVCIDCIQAVHLGQSNKAGFSLGHHLIDKRGQAAVGRFLEGHMGCGPEALRVKQDGDVPEGYTWQD